MNDRPGLSTGAFVARTSLFYAAFSLLIGIYMPIFPVWLEARGLDAVQVGLVLAAPAFARIVAVPIATRAADRHWGLREVMIVCSVATAIGYAALGLVSGALAILVLAMAASIPHTPMTALLDAYAVSGLKRHGRAYGPVRLWGSVSFIAANLAAGLMLDLIAARDLIWLIVAAAAFAGRRLGAHAAARARRHARSARRVARLVARSVFRRGAGGGKPDPGESCALLRLLDHRLEGGGL